MSGSNEGCAVVQLPEILDIKAAGPLARELLALRGRPVEVDAARVQRLGGLCLQVLLSARQTWTSDHVAIRFTQSSASFGESVKLFGADELLEAGGIS